MPSADKIKALIAEATIKRENAFAAVTTLFRVMRDSTTDLAEVYLDELAKLEVVFKEADDLIVRYNAQLEETDRDLSPSKFLAFFEVCLQIRAAAHRQRVVSAPPSAPATSSPVDLPIPRVQLPVFHGRIEEWAEFIALFDALVHRNASLVEIQKFHLLKSVTSGEAASIISGFELDPSNYPLAYQALQDRYQNPRRLADLYLHQVLDGRSASASSLAQLKGYVTTHRNAINAIRALPIPDLADYLLFSLALRNLDVPSRRMFEAGLSSDGFPTLAQLLEFSNRQLRILESTSATSSPSSAARTSPRAHSPATSAPSASAAGASSRRPAFAASRPSTSSVRSSACVFCGSGHSIRQCREFKAMTTRQRRSFVVDQGLCRNCMSAYHAHDQCGSDQSCHSCGARHHTILHLAPDAPADPSSRDHSSARHESLPSLPTDISAEITAASVSSEAPVRTGPLGVHAVRRRYGRRYGTRNLSRSPPLSSVPSASSVRTSSPTTISRPDSSFRRNSN